MKQLILITFVLSLVFSVHAQTEREYETDAFSALEISSAFQVHLEAGDAHFVRVECPSDLLDKVMIDVKNGALMISLKSDKWYKGWNKDASDVEVFVTCPELDRISVSGASKLTTGNTFHLDDLKLEISGASTVGFNATCDDLQVTSDGASSVNLEIVADKINVKASGASQLELRGEADDMVITASGASNIKAGSLKVEEAAIASSGASNINVWITGDLTVAATGASNIRYKCDGCDDVTVKTSGGSSVKKY